jgi:quercetin dioxygenase-like cupin family protein
LSWWQKHLKYYQQEVCKQCLQEASRLAPCEHPNVIKFVTIHSKTTEFTHCEGMGACFQKCCITTWHTHPLRRINCYCKKGALVWKGEDNLSPLGKIVWR